VEPKCTGAATGSAATGPYSTRKASKTRKVLPRCRVEPRQITAPLRLRERALSTWFMRSTRRPQPEGW